MAHIRKLFKSMQFQLIFWSVLALLLLAVLSGGYGFWYSYKELNDFQDDSLKSMSALLEQTLDVKAADSNTLLGSDIHFDTDDDDGSITVDVINTTIASPLAYSSSRDHNDENFNDITADDLPVIPVGISTKTIDDEIWRVYRNNSADRVIIVRQRTEFQDDLAKSSALQSFLPLIIGMAFLMLLLPFIMWRMLKPVRKLQREIGQRRESDLDPLLVSNLPTELLPLAEALNRLLALVKVGIERQQRFIADAAHELRSPLTAISLQLQRLQRHAHDPVMTEGLDKLAIRLTRNQKLVEQLLILARAGNVISNTERKSVSVKGIIEQVIGLLIPIVDSKNIDITVELEANDDISIDETSALVLIKNLIQNAIVYTPDKGQVGIQLLRFNATANEVKIHNALLLNSLGTPVIGSINAEILPRQLAGRLALQIMDSGKGIDSDDYVNVFEPFVRLQQSPKVEDGLLESPSDTVRSDSAGNKTDEIEGTGLGLSIVKSICEQAGIDVFMNASKLTDSLQDTNKGLCITLVF